MVAQAYEQRVDWFVLRADGYEVLLSDVNGVIRSEVFPGLWLPVNAVWQGNVSKMLAVLHEGLASMEHAEFIKFLEQKQG